MDTKTYSSGDFHKTYSNLTCHMPTDLIQKNVMTTEKQDDFSKERNHPVHLVHLPTKNISMTMGRLLPNQITNRHRHTYETLIYVLDGQGWSEIETRKVEWEAGDIIYIPSWAWHRHGNKGESESRYIACENAPQLQNLGLALREEEK